MSIGLEFLQLTKYQNMEKPDQAKGLPQPTLELEYEKTAKILNLPDPSSLKLGDRSLKQVINQRRSLRKYAETALSLEELTYLLWATQGVQKIGSTSTLRTVPSAGARHAFETYLLVNRVEGLEPGIYRYLALEHKLLPVRIAPGLADKVAEASLGQKFIGESAVTFIWVAVAYRMTYRYGERGFRYLFLDAGHVCQNLYLSAESINCGACAIDAFTDDDLNRLLNLDGKEQFVIYMAAVGKK